MERPASTWLRVISSMILHIYSCACIEHGRWITISKSALRSNKFAEKGPKKVLTLYTKIVHLTCGRFKVCRVTHMRITPTHFLFLLWFEPCDAYVYCTCICRHTNSDESWYSDEVNPLGVPGQVGIVAIPFQK